MARPASYNYSDAGFNGFFRRTLVSNPDEQVLQSSGGKKSNQLNFDDLQISGALGDKLKIGVITLDGKTGRISIDDDTGAEVLRIGDVSV